MHKKTNSISFEDISKEIINTNRFKSLKKEVHHGITRYAHVIRVSESTYKISKKLKMDYISATRAALLHDYFTSNDFNGENNIKKWNEHPSISYNNAIKEFNLNKKEENAIKAHMFPMGHTVPKYKESWLLTLVDKVVSTYEQYKYNWKNYATLYTVFIINMILFGQK